MCPPPAQDPGRRFAAARAAVARSWAPVAARDPVVDDQPPFASSPELAALVADALAAPDDATGLRATWLLLVALTGTLPSLGQLEDGWLALGTAGPTDLVVDTVTSATDPARSRLSECLAGTVVDVTTTARTEHHAGVPRVVRQLVSEWREPAGVTYVVWDGLGFRTLNEPERARLHLPHESPRPPGTWVAPYDATFVVTEVLRPEAHATAVEAMALAGVVDLRGIVYDLASLVEPHPDATHGPFLHHLSALSRGTRVSGISEAVAADVSDYFSIYARNGRRHPQVVGHVLPEEAGWRGEADELVLELDSRIRGDRSWPVIAVVSSVQRRKNHGRLLAACERLWAEGLAFRLAAIEGTGSRVPAVTTAIDRLVEQGRPVTLLSHVSEPELRAVYRLARVTAYVSLAEGYGLPIVESLAAGTPVVASDHGSMREIAAGGGVLMVDPRDERSIAEGLRRCLTEPACYDELIAGATARSQSTWQDYARTVGDFLGLVTDVHHDSERSGRIG
jgi:glycosyltransferase involved in cell wall biosynthesis